jgi:hypothetical protein
MFNPKIYDHLCRISTQFLEDKTLTNDDVYQILVMSLVTFTRAMPEAIKLGPKPLALQIEHVWQFLDQSEQDRSIN